MSKAGSQDVIERRQRIFNVVILFSFSIEEICSEWVSEWVCKKERGDRGQRCVEAADTAACMTFVPSAVWPLGTLSSEWWPKCKGLSKKSLLLPSVVACSIFALSVKQYYCVLWTLTHHSDQEKSRGQGAEFSSCKDKCKLVYKDMQNQSRCSVTCLLHVWSPYKQATSL